MLSTQAQTVAIVSDSFVCVNELLSLQSNISGGTATAYEWDFGDGTTSTQQNTQHAYNQFGPKTISLKVTFGASGAVTTTKRIVVHDLPSADFTVAANSKFCSHEQEICIVDNSTMGQTTSNYDSRLILWGDGASNSNSNPANGDTICYSDYPLIGTTKYQISVEVKNNKGCETIWTDSIEVLPSLIPSFNDVVQPAQCNRQVVCFFNDSSFQSTRISSFLWDFGDGTTNDSDWVYCHEYDSLGDIDVSLEITATNGCKVKTINTITTDFEQVRAKPNYFALTQCYPNGFFFSNEVIENASYTWQVFDADTNYLFTENNSPVINVEPPYPGDFYVRLRLRVNNCYDTSAYIKFSAIGTDVNFRALNDNLCNLDDTTFFFNMSRSHPSSIPIFNWNFDDTLATQCSTAANNCNFDTGFHSMHYYDTMGCYTPKLIVTHQNNTCIDSSDGFISTMTLNQADFFYSSEKPCMGTKPDYAFTFGNNICGSKMRICRDSLVNSTTFAEPLPGDFKYTYSLHPDNYVTVGIELTKGNEKVYQSADTNDFYIDYSRLCIDTTWMHNWFRLNEEPRLYFDYSADTNCLPVTARLKYSGNEESKLFTLRYRWNNDLDWQIDTITDTVPDMVYTYQEEGIYRLSYYLTDTNGCYGFRLKRDTFGYYNSFRLDTVVCENEITQMIDSLRYFRNSLSYWEDTSNIESLHWDFGDGNGFVTNESHPYISYPNKGRYQITLASADRYGCTDTSRNYINVVGVNAWVEDINREFLCDQIVQFFDSSYFDTNNLNDSVTGFYWDYGDSSTASYLRNPFHYYQKNGTYTLTHAVSSAKGCRDTATFSIYMKGPEPTFEITSDTIGCAPFTASFESTSANVSSLLWYMGDSANTVFSATKDTQLSFTYVEPGTYFVYLLGSDSFYNSELNNSYSCSTVFPDTTVRSPLVRKIVVLPIPESDFSFDSAVCVNQPVSFTNESDDIYTKFRWVTDNIDSTLEVATFVYAYSSPGKYAVEFYPSYDIDSSTQRLCVYNQIDTIEVYTIEASFTSEPIDSCGLIQFTNTSDSAISYSWDFGQPDSTGNKSTLRSPTYNYGKASGEFTVCLDIANNVGCSDTFCSTIENKFSESLTLYNVFTPNNDGKNDTYLVDISNYKFFHLEIFNRWGERVFETNDPTNGWDGNDLNNNKLPSSTYYYILNYSFTCESEIKQVEGQVEMLRE